MKNSFSYHSMKINPAFVEKYECPIHIAQLENENIWTGTDTLPQ
jgi:hypothetical protein